MATVPWKTLRENAEIPNNDPVPAGTYEAREDGTTFRPTATGKNMFMTTFVITAGPLAGRKVWNNFVVSPESPKAMGFFFKDMAALGADDAFFETEPTNEAICARIAGANVTITVRLQKDDPSRNEVARIAPAGGAAAASGGVPAASAPSVPAASAPGGAPPRPF